MEITYYILTAFICLVAVLMLKLTNDRIAELEASIAFLRHHLLEDQKTQSVVNNKLLDFSNKTYDKYEVLEDEVNDIRHRLIMLEDSELHYDDDPIRKTSTYILKDPGVEQIIEESEKEDVCE